MKKLSNLARAELGLDEMFAGKAWAFVAVLSGNNAGLGIAVANESGYHPVPLHWAVGDDFNAMADHADELNRDWLGLNDESAARIVTSSMFSKKKA